MARLRPRFPSSNRPHRRSAKPVSGPSLATIMLAGFLGGLVYFQSPDAVHHQVAALERWTAPPSFGDDAPSRWDDSTGDTGVNDTIRRSFGFCHSGAGTNCVVDGDTFWLDGSKIRIADIDTPETHPSRCDEEARLGASATGALQDWLNGGAFSVRSIDRDTDRYGRKLRIVTRSGESVGAALIDAGLARSYDGGVRAGWCDASS